MSSDSAIRHAHRLPRLLGRDVVRSFGIALVAALCAGVIEYFITATLAVRGWLAAGEDVSVVTLARLLCLDLALWALFWPLLGLLLAAISAGSRLCLRIFAGDRAFTWPGFLESGPRRERGATRLAAWMWALFVSALLFVPTSAKATLLVSSRFNAPGAEAVLLGLLQLVLFAVFAGLAYTLYRVVYFVGRRMAGRLGYLNPAGRPDLALATLCAIGLASAWAFMKTRPQLAPLVPWRYLIAVTALLFGMWVGARYRGRRGGLLPRSSRARMVTLFSMVFAGAVLVPVSLVRIGAEVHTKFVAAGHSPPLSSLIDLVRAANDFDGDGFGSLLGETDCAPFDAAIRPGVRDIADNGIDENCDGRDFSLSRLPRVAPGEKVEVPPEFRKPWNILLITIDTVRYDHTSFGGYIEKRKRDTTPRLAELVERSVSFEFAQAPSAGTMASIPAILTSKFFHSGIALGPDRKGMPPIMKGSNVLLPEILDRAGYTSGAILSHYYFNDWGMEQGFDTYDNELGAKNAPFKVTSHDLTDKALEWIARHHHDKWFLWVHYIDPHGRYVAHPDKSFGDSEEDLYDGELFYTDKHVGRLLDELANIPGSDRTIVVVTSDHGDGFGEHGFINHGMALYRELLHVPLIFYVPGANPQVIGGAVSALDVVPTLADLAGIDTSDLHFEGRSLVGAILYGREDPERIVFAETNWPKPLRAAISKSYKLVADLKGGVYELYDLRADPWEKRNVWKRDAAGSKKMRAALDDWLERVFYARDFENNQVTQGSLAGVLLESEPAPQHRARVAFDRGRIELLGYELEGEAEAGKTLRAKLYFTATAAPSGDFRIALEAWPETGSPIRGRPVVPGKGLLPTSRWRSGDYIVVPARVRLPRKSAGQGPVVLGLRLHGTRPVGDGVSVREGEETARLQRLPGGD